MKKLILILMVTAICPVIARSQASNITTSSENPGLVVTPGGEVEIRPSATSSASDFDFFEGTWEISNHKLADRLVNSNKWTDFQSKVITSKILHGIGDIGHFSTADGGKFEGFTLRLFNPKTKLWSIYWADSNEGILNSPVVGSFSGNIGTFYAKDNWNGKDVIALIKWDKSDPDNVKWSQAYSADNGKTWEWNWYMMEKRVSGAGAKTN